METPVLDTSIMDELISMSDASTPSFFREQVGLYLKRMHELRANIAKAQDDDYQSWKNFFHSVGGSSCVIGAMRVQSICHLLEDAALRCDLQKIKEYLPRLDEELDRADTCLNRTLENVYSARASLSKH